MKNENHKSCATKQWLQNRNTYMYLFCKSHIEKISQAEKTDYHMVSVTCGV